MAEKVSGWLALGAIALLQCGFIPTTTYLLMRTIRWRQWGSGYLPLDLIAVLIMIATLGGMITVIRDAQQIYPRCSPRDDDPTMQMCSIDRYEVTASAVAVSQADAVAWIRTDMMADAAQCLLIPSALGIAVLFVLVHVFQATQKRRTPNSNEPSSAPQ